MPISGIRAADLSAVDPTSPAQAMGRSRVGDLTITPCVMELAAPSCCSLGQLGAGHIDL
jgi:hypothetical protein